MGFFFESGLFEIIFWTAFVGVLVMFAVSAIGRIWEWNENNHSPKLTVEALLVSRRSQTSSGVHGAGSHMHASSATDYYVTFQVESGDRMEFHVSGKEYGMLAEGDRGTLWFQGTRYLSFDRRT